MKQHFIFGLTVLLLMILVPLVSLRGNAREQDDEKPATARQTQVAAFTQPETPETPEAGDAAAGAGDLGVISVVRTVSGKTETMGMREYLIGCVAAEMDAGSHPEALKAQAVASYTYARYRREAGGKAALSDSGKSDQGFEDAGQRRQRWGDSFELYEAKVAGAVDAVLGETVTYGGQPIFAAYSAISGGRSESAANYWGDDFPYLQSVESPGDKLSPGYNRTVTLRPEDVEKALDTVSGVKLGKDPAGWFGAPVRSEAGTVLEIEAGGKALTGRALRELLDLRSANFTIAFKDGAFEIKCLGYGHGVGMSQHGADFMARQGSDYKEILEHYYAGCAVGP